MNLRSEAEENLRVIRSLMEKATIYRAISAPTALVGGMASIIAVMLLCLRWMKPNGTGVYKKEEFLVCWLAVLLITAIGNSFFIWRDSVRRKEPFISAGMKMALGALFPPILTGGCFTAFFYEAPFILPVFWMIFYGLGLLATKPFSPTSIPRLGWAFLVCGLVCLIYLILGKERWLEVEVFALLSMTISFGLFHLLYAAFTWPRKSKQVS